MSNGPADPNLTVQNIRENIALADGDDAKAKQEEAAFVYARNRAELASFTQDITERKKYAGRVFWLVVFWLLAVGAMLFMQGLKSCFSFQLSDTVLITAITTTTASVVGIFLIVANYLFPKRAL